MWPFREAAFRCILFVGIPHVPHFLDGCRARDRDVSLFGLMRLESRGVVEMRGIASVRRSVIAATPGSDVDMADLASLPYLAVGHGVTMRLG